MVLLTLQPFPNGKPDFPMPKDQDKVGEMMLQSQMVGMINMLGVLAEYTNNVFSSLLKESSEISTRIASIGERCASLSQKLEVTERAHESIPLETFTTNPRTEYHAPPPEPGQLFTPDTAPLLVKMQYANCSSPPNLSLLDPFVEGGMKCLKTYSDPEFFVDMWIQEQHRLKEEARQARAERRVLREKRKAARMLAEGKKVDGVAKPAPVPVYVYDPDTGSKKLLLTRDEASFLNEPNNATTKPSVPTRPIVRVPSRPAVQVGTLPRNPNVSNPPNPLNPNVNANPSNISNPATANANRWNPANVAANVSNLPNPSQSANVFNATNAVPSRPSNAMHPVPVVHPSTAANVPNVSKQLDQQCTVGVAVPKPPYPVSVAPTTAPAVPKAGPPLPQRPAPAKLDPNCNPTVLPSKILDGAENVSQQVQPGSVVGAAMPTDKPISAPAATPLPSPAAQAKPVVSDLCRDIENGKALKPTKPTTRKKPVQTGIYGSLMDKMEEIRKFMEDSDDEDEETDSSDDSFSSKYY